MVVDTHAHLNFAAYKEDFDEVIRRCLDCGLWIVNVGSNYETSKRAVEIAQKYESGVYTAVGLHPIHLETGLVKIKRDPWEEENWLNEKEFDCAKYRNLAQWPRVVAIGEIGLDYYWKPKTKKKLEIFKQRQKDLLLKQLKLAKELNLPVIFHCRMAHQDLIEFLSENPEIRPTQAVAHGFVGNSEQLQKYLEFGFYIGFNGIIFKSIEGINFEENIKQTPLEKLLVETDCPYLAPPSVKVNRNEPIFVKHLIQKIAIIKNISNKEIEEITTQNAKNLFNLK